MTGGKGDDGKDGVARHTTHAPAAWGALRAGGSAHPGAVGGAPQVEGPACGRARQGRRGAPLRCRRCRCCCRHCRRHYRCCGRPPPAAADAAASTAAAAAAAAVRACAVPPRRTVRGVEGACGWQLPRGIYPPRLGDAAPSTPTHTPSSTPPPPHPRNAPASSVFPPHEWRAAGWWNLTKAWSAGTWAVPLTPAPPARPSTLPTPVLPSPPMLPLPSPTYQHPIRSVGVRTRGGVAAGEGHTQEWAVRQLGLDSRPRCDVRDTKWVDQREFDLARALHHRRTLRSVFTERIVFRDAR